MLACPCGGRIRIIAVIERPDVIRRILKHVGLRADPLPVAAARSPPEPDEWPAFT